MTRIDLATRKEILGFPPRRNGGEADISSSMVVKRGIRREAAEKIARVKNAGLAKLAIAATGAIDLKERAYSSVSLIKDKTTAALQPVTGESRVINAMLGRPGIVGLIAAIGFVGGSQVAIGAGGSDRGASNIYASPLESDAKAGEIVCSGNQEHRVNAGDTAYNFARSNVDGSHKIPWSAIAPHMSVERANAPDNGLVSSDVADIAAGDLLRAPISCEEVFPTIIQAARP